MNSQILTGILRHSRRWPEKHQFSYPVYFYRFDLNELPELARTIPGFGYNRFSIVRMDDKDYLWRGNQPIKEKIAGVLEKIGYKDHIARVELITFARYFNIIFRPISFFVCYNSANNCEIILAEVHNTFKETHLYVLKDPKSKSETLCFEIPKAFHVSPFFDMKGKYNLHFKDDGKTIDIAVNLIKSECGKEPVFFVRLTGQGHPFSSRTLYKVISKYPFNAVLNLPRIMRQALTLYFRKKLPIFSKPISRNEYTMRRQLPSFCARKCMNKLFSFFEKQSIGTIAVTLPEGKRRVFGSAFSDTSAELQINDYRFFNLIASLGEIGLGIAYEKGIWDSNDLVNFLGFMLNAKLSYPIRMPWYSRIIKSLYLPFRYSNKNTLSKTKKNISLHYDLSNEMFGMFLDETMTYSCAIFENEKETLADAQLRKIDLILKKANLSKDHHVLEIGTGWGTLAIRAASVYGCRVTSITLSKEQQQLAIQRIAEAGLSDRIEVLLCDYRKVAGHYDRIISVEMLEAVGKHYYPAFFRSCERLLKPNGTLVIQTITIPDQRYEAHSKKVDWIRLFIFPGGLLPSLTVLTKAITNHTSFVTKNIESIGPHYALTLARWKEGFLANQEKIIELGFSESFIRRWEYYFSYCETGFAQQYTDVLQIVLTRPRNQDSVNAFDQKIGRNKQQIGNTK